MKRSLFCILLALMMAFSAVSLGETVLRIGVMSGPTGMGMAQLMNTAHPEYSYEVYSAPTTATADLASGAIDLLCLPTNTAATLASRKSGFITVLAVNCLGSLYLLTDDTVSVASVADLAGQTILAGVPSSTTGPILEHILQANGISADIEWEADHDAVAARILAGQAHIAVLPEPKATAVLTQAQGWHMALNISDAWDAVTETRLPMGCIVARNEVLSAEPELVEAFLRDYEASVAFIGDPANNAESGDLIAAAGILPKAGVAMKALHNLYGAIVYEDGDAMKTDLMAFYDVIGQPQPDESFYAVR